MRLLVGLPDELHRLQDQIEVLAINTAAKKLHVGFPEFAVIQAKEELDDGVGRAALMQDAYFYQGLNGLGS